MARFLRSRPILVFLAVLAGLVVVGGGEGNILTAATAFSSLQYFSTFGLVALGLALTMLIGEFDISVGGLFGLGGCVAVLAGNTDPWIGLAAALATGLVFGVAQGLIITGFRLDSVAVTLGGLLTANGLAYVLTLNKTITFDNIDLALALNEPIAAILSPRSIVTVAFFVVATFIFGTTRIGRDLIATGSDRKAAMISGVRVDRLLVASFALSAALSALGGARLIYGLASASPAGLTDVLVPAIAAAILGGVSLSGGVGGPFGLAIGILTISLLRSGLNALGVPPFVNDVVSGAILLAVAIVDAPYLSRRLRFLAFRSRQA
jgi:ribose/xylose/arabinose/galactoside ABC-type transport system permease subunit